MTLKFDTLSKILEKKISAVIRAESREKALKTARACFDGGIQIIEITYTVPEAESVIAELSKSDDFKEAVIGAGSVMDSFEAYSAIHNGARFIVSPVFNRETAVICSRYQVPYIPGCFTPTEMITALENGADLLKLFPGNAFDPSWLKAVLAPMPWLPVMPTGGINETNAAAWLKNGAVCLGAGGYLFSGVAGEDYSEVTRRAAKLVAIVAGS